MDNINQKMKLHYLENLLKDYTDENHPLTSSEIIEMLENCSRHFLCNLYFLW